MKIKILRNIFMVLTMFLIFNSAFAQKTPIPVKIDEYKDKTENLALLKKKTKRFIQKLVKESKTTTGYILYFSEGINFKGRRPHGIKLREYIDEVLADQKSRINYIYGGLNIRRRENKPPRIYVYAKVEFWLAPQNAGPPEPDIIIFDHYPEACICPEISIKGKAAGKIKDKILTFTVELKGSEPKEKVTFEWAISAGKILRGQGTKQIKVDISDLTVKEINVSVKTDSDEVCEDCLPPTAAFKTTIRLK